ncbi:ABC transporter substrate-binding protein [Boseaceae bacterium BT-24-1]|nr:ABC transporter substrate-binding protein [Boseaceae bacterium BT-24-1]
MNDWKPSRRSVVSGIAAATATTFATPRVLAAPSGTPIRIGHQCDVTGGLASSGYWHRKTINIAAKWFNERGGFAGRPIEVVGIDSETKVDVGIARLRQLIQDQKVDFVIGSQHGGVAVASTALVKDERIPYYSMSRSEGVTEDAGNPFVYRLIVNTRQTNVATAKTMVDTVGKKWAVLYADYIWGQSHNAAWSEAIKAAGGEVIQSIPLPVNSNDPISFISKLNRSADGVFVALIGADLPKAFVTLPQLGFTRKPIVTADFVFGAFDPLSNGKYVEGVWGIDTLPWELSDKDTPHLRAFRDLLGIDPHGREVGTNRNVSVGETWPIWESLSVIKLAVEGSGWKQRTDGEALSKYIEAHPNYEEGELFPQGPLYIRPADHQAFCMINLLQIEGGKILSRHSLPPEAGSYPTKQKLAAR